MVCTVDWDVSDSALLLGERTPLTGEGERALVFCFGGMGGGVVLSVASEGVDIMDLQASRTIAGDLIMLECLVVAS